LILRLRPGAARGLGLAITQSLASQNANVMMADMDEAALNDALGSLPENTGKQAVIAANVTNETDVKALFDAAEASMKPEARERFVQMIPAKRTGAVEELADAVNFIVKNDYYTGRVLELDGGLRV